jgi:hypothetical protein
MGHLIPLLISEDPWSMEGASHYVATSQGQRSRRSSSLVNHGFRKSSTTNERGLLPYSWSSIATIRYGSLSMPPPIHFICMTRPTMQQLPTRHHIEPLPVPASGFSLNRSWDKHKGVMREALLTVSLPHGAHRHRGEDLPKAWNLEITLLNT